MSVENSFYLVDWNILKKKYEENQSTDFIGEALDNEEPRIYDDVDSFVTELQKNR